MFWTSAKMMIASRAALAPALEDRVPEDRYAELRSELVRRLSRPPYFFVHHDPNLVSDPEETKNPPNLSEFLMLNFSVENSTESVLQLRTV